MSKKKRTIALVLCTVTILCALAVFAGCSDEDNVMIVYKDGLKMELMQYVLEIYIKEDYEEKFKNQQFVVDDFDYEGIAEIRCGKYRGEGWALRMMVYFKETGIAQLEEAKRHFESLEFVRKVTFCYRQITSIHV